jgi:hypothetical protein
VVEESGPFYLELDPIGNSSQDEESLANDEQDDDNEIVAAEETPVKAPAAAAMALPKLWQATKQWAAAQQVAVAPAATSTASASVVNVKEPRGWAAVRQWAVEQGTLAPAVVQVQIPKPSVAWGGLLGDAGDGPLASALARIQGVLDERGAADETVPTTPVAPPVVSASPETRTSPPIAPLRPDAACLADVPLSPLPETAGPAAAVAKRPVPYAGLQPDEIIPPAATQTPPPRVPVKAVPEAVTNVADETTPSPPPPIVTQVPAPVAEVKEVVTEVPAPVAPVKIDEPAIETPEPEFKPLESIEPDAEIKADKVDPPPEEEKKSPSEPAVKVKLPRGIPIVANRVNPPDVVKDRSWAETTGAVTVTAMPKVKLSPAQALEKLMGLDMAEINRVNAPDVVQDRPRRVAANVVVANPLPVTPSEPVDRSKEAAKPEAVRAQAPEAEVSEAEAPEAEVPQTKSRKAKKPKFDKSVVAALEALAADALDDVLLFPEQIEPVVAETPELKESAPEVPAKPEVAEAKVTEVKESAPEVPTKPEVVEAKSPEVKESAPEVVEAKEPEVKESTPPVIGAKAPEVKESAPEATAKPEAVEAESPKVTESAHEALAKVESADKVLPAAPMMPDQKDVEMDIRFRARTNIIRDPAAERRRLVKIPIVDEHGPLFAADSKDRPSFSGDGTGDLILPMFDPKAPLSPGPAVPTDMLGKARQWADESRGQ